MHPTVANGFFAQPASAPLSNALSSTTGSIQAFTLDDEDDVPIAASDKYYVPRAKDVAKKQRERDERERREREQRERKAHRTRDVGAAKEELDFSDDEDDELDGLGGAMRDGKAKVRTQQREQKEEEHKEEQKEEAEAEAEAEEKQQPARITVVTHKPAVSTSLQPTVLTRTVPRGSEQKQKEEMSDEEDEDVEANTKHRKQPTLAQRMSDEEQPSPHSSHTAASTATANVAPLINPVALSFFLRRLALTAMGGLQLSFTAGRPPARVYVLSIASFVAAPLLVLVFSLLDRALASTSHRECVYRRRGGGSPPRGRTHTVVAAVCHNSGRLVDGSDVRCPIPHARRWY